MFQHDFTASFTTLVLLFLPLSLYISLFFYMAQLNEMFFERRRAAVGYGGRHWWAFWLAHGSWEAAEWGRAPGTGGGLISRPRWKWSAPRLIPHAAGRDWKIGPPATSPSLSFIEIQYFFARPGRRLLRLRLLLLAVVCRRCLLLAGRRRHESWKDEKLTPGSSVEVAHRSRCFVG